MKIKRSSSKKQLAKWTKLGVGLAAVTVLGGLVEPGDVPLLSNCTVEAQELTNQNGGEQALPADTATVTIELENTGVVELVGGSYRYQRIRGFERLEIYLQPGETYTLPTYDGYKLINFKNLNEVTDIAPEDAVLSYADFTPGQRVRLYYDYLMTDQVYDGVTKQYVDRETVIPSTTHSINSPTDTPTAQPAETSVEQPTEQPVEQPADKPVETPAEKQVISSEVKILNLDGSTYWRGDWGDEAVVGTTTVELEVGGELTIPATAVPTGYEITDIRFNILSTGVKELPHTWTYEEYKNYTSAPLYAPAIDILVKPVSKTLETPVAPQPAETPVVTSVDKPVEIPVDSSVTKPAETPSETPAKSPAETPTNQPSADQEGQSATEPTVLYEQDSQAGTASPNGQSAHGKQVTKQGDKEQAPSASSSQKEEVKPAPTSQPQAKTLPATGEASSVLHLTGLGLLGLAGLVVKRRPRKSS